ncbi:unnamed protein product [Cuscuta campestris]|uniref:Uncharacterized protein n=1 Tax=Cuscuta campestris TaxID=132261 RepID=A0A484LVV4_9ASTE|nr:unnamed protein product [Cuscuta campestris]
MAKFESRVEKMLMEYMQRMNNIADDLKERDKTRDNQLQQVFKLGVHEQGNLSTTTEPNLREQLQTITLSSGKELQGPVVEEDSPVDTTTGSNSSEKTNKPVSKEKKKEGSTTKATSADLSKG